MCIRDRLRAEPLPLYAPPEPEEEFERLPYKNTYRIIPLEAGRPLQIGQMCIRDRDTSPQKLKSNLARAGRLVEQIRELKESLEAEGYDRFETELAQINTRIVNTEQDLKRYEEARRREIYQKGSSALKLLQEACREAASLQRFNREDLERWQMLQSKAEPLQTEERRIREELGLSLIHISPLPLRLARQN